MDKSEIIKLLQKCAENEIDAIKTENLYFFDGAQGFSLGQGQ
jgi:isocitrate dehydrogenase